MLTLGGRPLGRVLGSVFGPQHYRALLNMFRVYEQPLAELREYLFGGGTYPRACRLRTPAGPVAVSLYTRHDLLTVNEIFCRLDYGRAAAATVVVDLGSNIGISALFFLSGNPDARCYLFEPDPRNTERLRRTLHGFEARYVLAEAAVGDRRGMVTFGREATGRYGGVGLATGETIVVSCLHINDAVAAVLRHHARIDLLKIDTEGLEIPSVMALAPELASRIDRIVMEATPEGPLRPDLFRQRQEGSVCVLERRSDGAA